MIHLIQGVLFQKVSKNRLAFSRVTQEPFLMLRCVIVHSMYMGMFGPDPNPPGKSVLAGRMNDHYGNSILTDIKITDSELSFTKKYDHREDLIYYKFRKQEDGTWKGAYKGKATGHGKSRCILTSVSPSFTAGMVF